MNTRTRVVVTLLLAFLTIIVLFGAAIYYTQNEYTYNDLYERLRTRAHITAIHHYGSEQLDPVAVTTLRDRYLEKLAHERSYVVPAEGEDLAELAKEHQLPLALLKDVLRKGDGRYRSGNTFYAGIKHHAQGTDHLVVVSADNYYTSHHLAHLRGSMLIGIVLAIGMATMLSLFFSRRILNPIDRITKEVKQISTDNLHLRLVRDQEDHEVSRLTDTFNELLDRLETAFGTQRNFISNASHELSTPLTAIIGASEVALAKERSPEEYRNTIADVLQQAERLDKITRSLLFMAQTGYEGKKFHHAPTRMDAVVWAVKETMDQMHPGNQVQLDLGLLPDDPRKLKVDGNSDLLHMAVANIVTNAWKYSQNKPVRISVAASDRTVIISVQDKGIGIPEAELPFIFDPFFRASNTSLFDGFGIGLPLSRNIFKLHNGKLSITSQVGQGTTVRIELPSLG